MAACESIVQSSVQSSVTSFFSALGKTSTVVFTTILIIVSLLTCAFRHASPARLTDTLIASLQEAEQLYNDALETGVLDSTDEASSIHLDADLVRLQHEVSEIRETTLRNSLSRSAIMMLPELFWSRRSFKVIQCLKDVKRFKTHIKILKEIQIQRVRSGIAGYHRRRRPVAAVGI